MKSKNRAPPQALPIRAMLHGLLAVVALTGSLEAEISPPDLQVGVRVERALAGGEGHLYSLNARAGEYLEVEVEQQGVDIVLSLLAADGEALVQVDSPNGSEGLERLRTVVAAGGALRLEVRSPSAQAAPGRYRLTWRVGRPATSEDHLRARADAALGAGQIDVQGGGEALARAVEALTTARDDYRRLEEVEGEAEALFQLSVALRRLGRYREALEQAEAALYLEQDDLEQDDLEQDDPVPNDLGRRARLLNGIALIHRQLGNDLQALEAYEKALVLWRRAGVVSGEATTLNNLAVVHARRGDHGEAVALYRAALVLWTRLGSSSQRVSTLSNLGQLHQRRGDLRIAVECYKEALAIVRTLENPGLLALTLNNLGTAYAALGDFDSSVAQLHEGLAIRRQLGIRREIAQTLNNLGWVYFKAEEPRRALPFFQEAVRLTAATDDDLDRASYLENLGRAHRALGELATARSYLEEALALSHGMDDQRGASRRQEALGWVRLELGQLVGAQEVLEEAVLAGRRLGERVTEANAHAGLSALHRRRGNLPGALEEIEEALKLVESLRGDAGGGDLRASYLALRRPIYEAQIDLLMELHRRQLQRQPQPQPQVNWAGRALGASERAKARSLLESLGAARSEQLAPRLETEPLALDAIRSRVLDEGTLLLEIALGDERSFLWLVSLDGVETFQLPPRQEIEAAGRRVAEGLALPPSQDRGQRLALRGHEEELASLLLAPVAHRLGNKRLLVVAEGVLLYLPFGALPDPRSREGEPLLVRNEVVTAPSASVLALLRREAAARSSPKGTLAIFADPVFSGDSFLPLPASTAEAAAIGALVPGEQKMVVLGVDASKDRALSGALGDYRYLHFATHGVLNSRSPQLSALVLSQHDRGGRPVDGFLRLEDIYGLRLSADLVVLSACRTALGKEVRGEGLLGLVRGFMYAGAPRVVASLWQVDDRATAALMERFYRGMLRDGLPAAAALRQAQLSLRRGEANRSWRDPYYWSAFQLQGEWR